MAAFGAPEALEDHAERSLHTALAMQRRLEAVFAGELSLRLGVNTGEVVAGRPREGSSFVSGDAVNVAARLEQAAEPGEILAGERTVAAVRGAFEFGEPRIIEAKGKAGGVACRPLVRALSLMRTRGVADSRARSSGATSSSAFSRRRTAGRSMDRIRSSSRSSATPASARHAWSASSGNSLRSRSPSRCAERGDASRTARASPTGPSAKF